MHDVKATLLGTGHAWPVPQAGCGCDQCRSAREDAKERRTRSAVFLVTPAGRVLLDASPDVAAQFERERLEPDVDLVVISHHHDDHLFGLRDLCHLRRGGPSVLPVHCGPVTERRIRAMWSGLLRPGAEKIHLVPWHAGALVELGPVLLEGFETHHRVDEPTTAFLLHVKRGRGADERIARVAYATDMGMELPSPHEQLQDLDLFVGDGTYLGAGGHGHPGTDRVLEIARELGARRMALTHVGHWALDPDRARQALPDDVVICRDGDDLLSLLD